MGLSEQCVQLSKVSWHHNSSMPVTSGAESKSTFQCDLLLTSAVCLTLYTLRVACYSSSLFHLLSLSV